VEIARLYLLYYKALQPLFRAIPFFFVNFYSAFYNHFANCSIYCT
jgi:hypothetical protein